jgi:ABC-type bacteriocin/lantibiotic exporter with double-glycine peptidase domain
MLLIKNLHLPNGIKISWDWDGQPVHLTGKNGAGKSLLLKAMSSLYPCHFEEFKLNGIPRNNLNPSHYRSQIVYLAPQISFLNYERASDFYKAPLQLQIYNNHSYPQELEQKLKEWNIFDKKCQDLSSGEKQILSLTRALALKAKAILIDEALTHLDSARKDWILTYMLKKTKSHEQTYIIVSHEDNIHPAFNKIDISQIQNV